MNMHTKTIHAKLNEARVRLQDMNLKKSGYNKFAGFKYYELADFLPAVNKIMLDLGICAIFSINESENEDKDGKRQLIATLKILNAGTQPYELIVFASPIADAQLKGCTPLQGIGAIHTYMKRYLYLNALEIVEHDALDFKAGEIMEEEPIKDSTLEPEILETIGRIKTIEGINDIYIRLSLHKPDNNEWKWLLKEKAKVLKCTFDKEAKKFFANDKDQIKLDFAN